MSISSVGLKWYPGLGFRGLSSFFVGTVTAFFMVRRGSRRRTRLFREVFLPFNQRLFRELKGVERLVGDACRYI